MPTNKIITATHLRAKCISILPDVIKYIEQEKEFDIYLNFKTAAIWPELVDEPSKITDLFSITRVSLKYVLHNNPEEIERALTKEVYELLLRAGWYII